MPQQADFPVREPIAEKTDLTVTDRWRIWLRNLRADVDKRSSLLANDTKTGQSASLAATPFLTDTLVGGMYRASAFLHVTTVGTVTSSILVTFGFTHNAVACSLPTVALTTNLTTSVHGESFPIVVDAGTPITWATVYASNAPATMVYTVSVALESVNA